MFCARRALKPVQPPFQRVKDGDEECATPDEYELEDFIENGGAQREGDIGGNGERTDDDRKVQSSQERSSSLQPLRTYSRRS